ncbi:hypothetical protein H257_13533 [Aphanomyces astaci]|uniref:Gamma tubulin complex component C-terminal domain-containing protein n=1 Tax=Aphanomyces astaci TaxID=112090 RepID=W4FW39_APHAT|nr:hypothetical protein H257_13533 [Aphanomyces astaci]ETV71136.1 hypothetical protein H257_13533 [Aphanomyces astaci]|eukprot:XP_009839382.1 hypothetical protein H257_13533 [Aphanomyces astaci]
MLRGDNPATGDFVGLLQTLHKKEVGTRGSIKDLRHALDILLFTHAATTLVEVDSTNAAAFVVREYASLAYYLRQHSSLQQVADGIDAIIDHHVQGPDPPDDDMLSILRVLLALSGGTSGRSYADTNLGPRTLQLARQHHPFQAYNRRMGETIVQSNVNLANDPHSLFRMGHTVSSCDAKDMLDAMQAMPGHSAFQSDFWHDKATPKPADLFGALQHSAFDRTDSQLVRFDLRLSVPALDETPPDLISNALTSAKIKHLPRRRQRVVDISSTRCSSSSAGLLRPPPLDTTRGGNCLLFSAHKSTIDVDLGPSIQDQPKPSNQSTSLNHPHKQHALLQVWENLGPNKVQLGRRLMLGSPTVVASNRIAEATLVACLLDVLNGIDSAVFPSRGLFECCYDKEIQVATNSRIDVSDLLDEFARTGTFMRRLSALARDCGHHDMHGGRRVLQCLGTTLQYFIAGHHAFVLELKHNNKSLVQLWAATSTLRRRLRHVAALFLCDDDTLWQHQQVEITLPTGVALLNRIYHGIVQTQFCDPSTAALSMWFFTHVSVPYFEALTHWVFVGKSALDDAYLEFAQDQSFECLECLQHKDDDTLNLAIAETRSLLQVTRAVHSQVYYLTSSKWHPLQLVTDHDALHHYLAQHAVNLATTRSAVQAYSDAQMQAVADSVYALNHTLSTTHSHGNTFAHHDMRAHDEGQRQVKRLKQQVQRKLLDEQVAHNRDLALRLQAQGQLDHALQQTQLVAAQEKADQDNRRRLVEIYADLMAKADRKHRRALWRQARVRRKEHFKAALTKLYRLESSAWYAGVGMDVPGNHPEADPMATRISQTYPSLIGTSTSHNPLDNPKTPYIKKSPRGDSLKPPTNALNNDDTVGMPSSVRVLKAPGGGGQDASNVIYHGDQEKPVDLPTTRVTQEAGGSGTAASDAIYHANLERPVDVPHVRILQAPGGTSKHAAGHVIYPRDDQIERDLAVHGSSVRVLQEPGGSGRAASALLYPDEEPSNLVTHVNHVRILQDSGGDGNVANDLIYGRNDAEYASPRASVRVSQAPGGNGDELSDTLYAQFSTMAVQDRPSVKVLGPSGGGHDSVSSLVFGGLTEAVPPPKRQDLVYPTSNITMEWAAAPTSRLTPPRQVLAHETFATATLTGDYARVLETYRALMDQDVDPVEYAPIESLIRCSLVEPILNQRSFVGSVALTVFRDHVHLMQHLQTLHDIMLLSGGLWVEQFMHEFIQGLDASSRVNWGVPGALNDLLAHALEEAQYDVTRDSTMLFAFRPTDELETLLGATTIVPSLGQVLEGIEPVYALPTVLTDVVVPVSTLHLYVTLHKHLFQLKAIAVSMQSVRRVLRTHHTIVARSGHLMLHVMHHLCATLVAHCFQSIAEEWHRFQLLAESCRDAVAFKRLHDGYVHAVATRCFLDSASVAVHAKIQACLSRVMLVVEVVQNNGTRAVALKRALGHLADTAQGVDDGTLRALCDELRRSSAPAAQELLLRLDFGTRETVS